MDEERVFRFGEFLFDTAEETLVDLDEKHFQLSARLKDLLLFMVERPGQLLRKSHLLENVWSKVIVEENSLNQAVAALRKALRENSEERQYIETVPGKGYRFVMPVINKSEMDKQQPPEFTLKQEIKYCTTPDGVSLAYSVMGEGHPLILMPTWLGHLEAQFESPVFQNYIQEFSEHYQLIRFDLRGFGLSERNIETVTFDDYITDMETIVNHLQLDKVALIGPSGGGMFGSGYAARHPERVSHLILLSGFIRGGRRIGSKEVDENLDMIDSIIKAGWGKLNSPFSQAFCTMLLPDGTHEQHERLDRDQKLSSTGENAEQFFRVLNEVDLTSDLKAMDVPTLVCHGTHENGVPFSEGEYAAATIPNSCFVRLPTKNHVLQYDEPAWPIFTKAVHEFIASS